MVGGMNRDLKEWAERFSSKLKRIKVLAFDVDGILTNGLIWYGGKEVGWNRFFNTRDGYMMRELMKRGYKVGIMTGGESLSIAERFSEGLGVDFIFSGNEDKMVFYRQIKKMGFENHDILYMGDEFFDLPVLESCGFSATAPEASVEIKESVDYVTETPAGMGAAREVMDMFRYANGITC